MASVADNTLNTVGNVINTTHNIQNLTPKGLAKKAAKDTGRALVEPHQPSTSGPSTLCADPSSPTSTNNTGPSTSTYWFSKK